MAQLIKLQDYISRYEIDVYRYPARFIRLKMQQWEKVRINWERQRWLDDEGENQEETEEEPVQQGIFTKLKLMLHRQDEPEIEPIVEKREKHSLFDMNKLSASQNLEELKQLFLDQLFNFQVKWASSTILEKSYVDYKYFHDERLKFLLQRLPDTFLLLYYPVLSLKKAPMELDMILLTPTEAWCLTFLEEEDQAVYIGSSERFWQKRFAEKEMRILSPMLALNRMETVVKRLFLEQEVELSIRKAVICRNGFIDYPNAPFDLQVIDERSFPSWFNQLRRMSSPLKLKQLKAAKCLLDFGQTTSVRRPEWEEEEDFVFSSEASEREKEEFN
ncbi:hypothetical protein [Bacillus xiapuensis]|uniref:hypothetical protein n=1 Tax=Bacillus xiapuensis TaxID=2014075 RepID=UPI000C24E641|nr:hypothetical protein [Bacillus xiapuensis]